MQLRRRDLFTDADFDRARAEKLINVRPSGDGQLILNYTDAAMYTAGAFDNPAVRICRGLITTDDPDPLVVARPWAKFFNFGQVGSDVIGPDEPVEVTDKADGSLGILHLDPRGRPRVASRGSFTSDQALHATNLLHVNQPQWLGDPLMLRVFTPLVEIVYPENRIVLDYGPTDTLVLLGAVHTQTGVYISPLMAARMLDWGGPVTEVFSDWQTTLRDALSAPPRPNAEGLVVRAQNRIVKIKQGDYIALHRIVTGLSERSVWEHLTQQLPIEDLLAQLPDELHLWTREVAGRLTDTATSQVQRAREVLRVLEETDLPAGWTRKQLAIALRSYTSVLPLGDVFGIVDGRDIAPKVLDRIKPAGAVRARVTSEDVA